MFVVVMFVEKRENTKKKFKGHEYFCKPLYISKLLS